MVVVFYIIVDVEYVLVGFSCFAESERAVVLGHDFVFGRRNVFADYAVEAVLRGIVANGVQYKNAPCLG